MITTQKHADASLLSMFLTIQVAMNQLLTSTPYIFQATLAISASARLLMTLSLTTVLELTAWKELQTIHKKNMHQKLFMYLVKANVNQVLHSMLVHALALKIINAISTVLSYSQAHHSRTHSRHASAFLRLPST